MLGRISAFLLTWAAIAAAEDGRLILSQVIWSAGSSSPSRLIPSDAVNDEGSWADGLGALTQAGREEALRLGHILNARYVQAQPLLSNKDAQRKSYVRSADCNRSLTTAAAVMAGLLPLSPAQLGTQQWPLYWLPFPVHSVPAQYDALLGDEVKCPTVEEKIPAKLVLSPVFRDHSNLQFLEFILTKSGFGELTWETLFDIYSALDSIKGAGSGNHTWPLWMDEAGFLKLKSLVDFSAAAAFSDESISRLKGGPLLKEMLQRMQTKIRCLAEVGPECQGVSELSFYGYSGCPLLLHALLTALGHVPGSIPGPAAAVALELWHMPNGFEVRALYHDGLSGVSKLREFSIGDCPELNCTLAAFEERSRPFLPWNWEKECGLLTKGLSSECEGEIDNSEEQSCRDWARHGLCDEQPAVRFVFCRRTCLCDASFAKKARKFRLV